MRMDVGQQMRMSQQMKLTPRMIQSMEILQLSSLALEERIDQELADNPLLEVADVEPDDLVGTDDSSNSRSDDDVAEGEKPLVVHDNGDGDNREDFQRLNDMTEQYGQIWDENMSGSSAYRPASTGERDGKMDAMANTAARDQSLTEQLLDQWRYVELDEQTRHAGEFLITFIDDDGYLRTDMEEIFRQAGLGITLEALNDALIFIQKRLEPVGIGACDLAECLIIQIDSLIDEQVDNVDDDLLIARRLVADHQKDIEMNRLPHIAKQTGYTIDQIASGLKRLRRFDPRPGRELTPEHAQVIIPDVIVEYDSVNDTYIAAPCRNRQATLRINPQYRDLSKDRTQEKKTREYLSEKMRSARWLIDSIDQRNHTLMRVVNAVLDVQRDFLDRGTEYLKPLPMVSLADRLGIHVGTVSRAVSGKYIQTPRGIFPLRMFFSGGTESSDGKEMSWQAVQRKLKQIIDEEDKSKPLLDEELVGELEKQGISIKRRTVAKYRNQLDLPPARLRKRF